MSSIDAHAFSSKSTWTSDGLPEGKQMACLSYTADAVAEGMMDGAISSVVEGNTEGANTVWSKE